MDRVRLDPTVAQLRRPAFKLVDRMQDLHPADQLRATFIAAVALSEACGLDPYEEVQRAKRMMDHAEGPFTYHVQAIRDYAAGELLRKESA
jgi:hypothetical protein